LENDGTITRSGGGTSKIELSTKNRGTITISGDSGLELPNGFEQGAGQLIVDGSLVLGSSGKINGGKVTGSGSVQGDVNFCDGPPGSLCLPGIAPGNSPGSLEVLGNVSFAQTSTLEIELAGTTQGVSYDLLSISGTASLMGELEVTLLSGFVPELGHTFEFLTAGTMSGEFDSIVLPTLASGLAWDIDYDSNSVSLTVVEPISGDFDFDGDVDGRDFLAWQRGDSPDPFSASDLVIWQTEYNGGALSALKFLNGGGTPPANAVPEPGSFGLLLGLMTTVLVVRPVKK
jgi:hypothetical protein